jgi:hypothetical protein
MDWLKTIAPTLATLLGGPLAGLAVDLLGPKLGITDATKDKINEVLQNDQLTGDQIVAVKAAELEAKAKEGELGFKFAELEYKDIDSARNREVQVKDNVNKILAYTVVGSFIAMVAATLMGYAKVESVLAGTLVGYLSAKAEQVLAYYFGSTKGSADKTKLLANSVQKT